MSESGQSVIESLFILITVTLCTVTIAPNLYRGLAELFIDQILYESLICCEESQDFKFCHRQGMVHLQESLPWQRNLSLSLSNDHGAYLGRIQVWLPANFSDYSLIEKTQKVSLR